MIILERKTPNTHSTPNHIKNGAKKERGKEQLKMTSPYLKIFFK